MTSDNEEGRPVHWAAPARSVVILEPTVRRSADTDPMPRQVVPFVARGVPLESDARLAGELAAARVAAREPWSSRRSLSASRSAWLHLQFCALVDDEGFVEGILRNLGEAS